MELEEEEKTFPQEWERGRGFLQVAESGSLLALMSCVAGFREGGLWKMSMRRLGVKGSSRSHILK